MSIKVVKLLTGERVVAFVQAIPTEDGFPLIMLKKPFEFTKVGKKFKLIPFPEFINPDDTSIIIEPDTVAYTFVPVDGLIAAYNELTGMENVVPIHGG